MPLVNTIIILPSKDIHHGARTWDQEVSLAYQQHQKTLKMLTILGLGGLQSFHI